MAVATGVLPGKGEGRGLLVSRLEARCVDPFASQGVTQSRTKRVCADHATECAGDTKSSQGDGGIRRGAARTRDKPAGILEGGLSIIDDEVDQDFAN
jgi:hypothetical protein